MSVRGITIIDVYDNAKAKRSEILALSPTIEGRFCSMTVWLSFLVMPDVLRVPARAMRCLAPAFRPANISAARYRFLPPDTNVTLLCGFSVGMQQRFSRWGVLSSSIWNLPIFCLRLNLTARKL